MTAVLSVRPPSPALLFQPMCILPSGKNDSPRKQHASYTPAIFWKGRAMVTSFLHEFGILSQGIRANLAQWLERAANNRKAPGSNPGSAPSPFLFTWGPSITICAGSVRCLAGGVRCLAGEADCRWARHAFARQVAWARCSWQVCFHQGGHRLGIVRGIAQRLHAVCFS